MKSNLATKIVFDQLSEETIEKYKALNEELDSIERKSTKRRAKKAKKAVKK